LRKGAFYLARIAHLKHQPKIDALLAETSPQDRKANVARKFIEAVSKIGKDSFDDARKTFNQALQTYLAKEGGNEDAALKNTEFAKKVDTLARSPQPKTPQPEK
jgi:16S rRNA A1518/A1519 N6-dimethyltransferase RsmA/KsgA/DIM1 with predicted DNA glycosylase/AP lyase activity